MGGEVILDNGRIAQGVAILNKDGSINNGGGGSSGGGVVISLPDSSGNASFSATGTGQWVLASAALCQFQTVQNGAGTAVVEIHGSSLNTVTPSQGTLLCTLTTTSNDDSATQTKDQAVYKYKLAKVITLTATSVSVTMEY